MGRRAAGALRRQERSAEEGRPKRSYKPEGLRMQKPHSPETSALGSPHLLGLSRGGTSARGSPSAAPTDTPALPAGPFPPRLHRLWLLTCNSGFSRARPTRPQPLTGPLRTPCSGYRIPSLS